MGKNDKYYDVDFSNYKATTTNPGTLLLQWTVICCLLCFFLGFLCIPGKILHPLSKRLQEYIAWWQSRLDGDDDEYDDKYDDDDDNDDEVDTEIEVEEVRWKEVVDEESGDTFYYNLDTKKSTWRKPIELYKASSRRKKRFLKRQEKRKLKEQKEQQKQKEQQMKQKQSQKNKSTSSDLDNDLLSNEHSQGQAEETTFDTSMNVDLDVDDPSHLNSNSHSNVPENGTGTGSSKTTTRTFKFGRSKAKRQLHGEEDILTIGDFTGGLDFMFIGGAQAQEKEKTKVEVQVEPPMKNPGKARRKEIRSINAVAIPWMFQSVISEGSSIVTLMMISHLMSLRDLLAYSNVWFIIYLAFVINDAWYNALYKHVNISAALETTDGYTAAGRYIKIGMIGNIIIAIPLSVVGVLYMPLILEKMGYDASIAEISQYYTIVAILNNVFDTTTGIVDCVLDIEGHAKWGAIFDFWDTIFSTVATYFFIVYVSPSLLELGILHFGLSILSTILYFKMTGRKGWFEKYRAGMSTRICSLHWRQIWKLVKMALPLTAEAIIGNIEYAVFTVFAAYQGAAEAAAWILLSYVWTMIGIVPDTFSSAASCHVQRIISNGEVELAKMVSKRSVYIATYISIICSTLMWIFRQKFIWCLAVDETLDGILLEVIPYICLCYPLMTVGGAASELNDALHLYKRVMVSMAIVTVIIMVPIGYVMTYIYEYNIEGLACAQCIGYTAAGVINIVFFINADWEKAVVKAHDISDAGADNDNDNDGGNSPDYRITHMQWSELSKEARHSAEVIGYDEQIWDSGEQLDIDRRKMSRKQKAAVSRLQNLNILIIQ